MVESRRLSGIKEETEIETIVSSLDETIRNYLPDAAGFILKVIVCILVYVAGRKLIGYIVSAVRRVMERSRVSAGAATFLLSMLKILLYLVLILGIAMQFGLQESSVAALVASGGVAVGLAIQGGLSNFAGGFLILMFQPFAVGDYICTQGQEGTVVKIEILYTTLLTVDNRKVIVPNGNLANNVIVNNTAEQKRKLDIRVGVSYEDNIQHVREVLTRLAEQDEYILQDQEVRIFVDALAEGSVIIGMRAWVKKDQYLDALWQMNEKIKETFEREEIHIPYPQLDVHLGNKG